MMLCAGGAIGECGDLAEGRAANEPRVLGASESGAAEPAALSERRAREPQIKRDASLVQAPEDTLRV